jgi:hypothetical protein
VIFGKPVVRDLKETTLLSLGVLSILAFLGVLLVETIDSSLDKTKKQRVTNDA